MIYEITSKSFLLMSKS